MSGAPPKSSRNPNDNKRQWPEKNLKPGRFITGYHEAHECEQRKRVNQPKNNEHYNFHLQYRLSRSVKHLSTRSIWVMLTAVPVESLKSTTMALRLSGPSFIFLMLAAMSLIEVAKISVVTSAFGSTTFSLFCLFCFVPCLMSFLFSCRLASGAHAHPSEPSVSQSCA